jgi:glycosyltransferase involved in cell wall biosynthesis
MQITFLSFWHPHPADNGAKLRVMALLRALAREHSVDLVILASEPADTDDSGPVAKMCRSIRTVAVPQFSPHCGLRLRDLIGTTPRSLLATYDPAVSRLIERRIAAGECDIVICGDLAAYYGKIAARSIPVFIDELDPSRFVDGMRLAPTMQRRLRAALTWWKYRLFARQLLGICAGFFVVSEREAALLRAIAPHPDRVVIVPNGVHIAQQPELPGRIARRLVYSGSPTYAPNLDAVSFFAADILPRIRSRIPDAWLAVTGKTEGVQLTHLMEEPGMTFTGWLPDIRAYVAASRVCVVPLREGGGTRLKILEAMAVGTPVVSTTKGAEGLNLTDGEDILIADDPGAFADATVRLLSNDALHARLASHARTTVAARYDWEAVCANMLAALARLTGTPQRGHATATQLRGDESVIEPAAHVEQILT